MLIPLQEFPSSFSFFTRIDTSSGKKIRKRILFLRQKKKIKVKQGEEEEEKWVLLLEVRGGAAVKGGVGWTIFDSFGPREFDFPE